MGEATPARARKDRKQFPQIVVDEAVDRIVDEMARGVWTPATTKERTQLVMAAYNAGYGTVKRWSDIAHQMRRPRDEQTLERERATTLAALKSIAQSAAADGRPSAAVRAWSAIMDLLGLKQAEERRLRVIFETMRQSDEWTRLRALLTTAAARFKDPDDRIILLDAIDEFEGTPKQLVEGVVVEASEVT